MSGILQGMRVIEVSAFIAAPLAGMTLAQMGADVIRVDPLAGGLDYNRWPLAPSGQSLYWAGLNKGKRSVTLDLRSPQGRGMLEEMIIAPGADAGILLTNLGPGAVPSYEALARRRADVIVVQIVGSPDGTPAVDYTVNCAVGFPGITGPCTLSGPVNHALPAWDMLCGTSAAMAVLAAERQRRATGKGQLVRIALSDVAMAMAGHLGYLAEAQVAGSERGRHGNAVYGSFGRDFPTRDGRRVMIVAVTPRQWHSILTATGLTEAVARFEAEHGIDCRREADRWGAREPLFRLIEAWTSTRDYADIKRLLDQHDVLWGPYQSFAQLLEEDPRCSLANPMFAAIDQPAVGRHLAPGCAVDFGGGERVPVTPAPRLGSHTDDVLAELLNLGKAERDRLRAAGVIAAVADPQDD